MFSSQSAARITDLGLKGYPETLLLQKETVQRKKEARDSEDVLFLVEHPDVYTFGRKSGPPPPNLKPVYQVERGGEATYHCPGQLVVYPVFSLEENEKDAHRFLRNLEEVLILVLKNYGIESERRDGATGVWIPKDNRKIASLGVAISGWVTYHGLALNVNNSLEGFSKINPCGFSAGVMTSLKEYLGEKTPSVSEVKSEVVKAFSQVFPNRKFLK